MKPKKHFGQNFLVNQGVVRKIVAADPMAKKTSLEIGPGPGVLTRELVAAGAHVTAVDADVEMITKLSEELCAAENLALHHGDILQFDPTPLAALGPITVVGNIPYNISSPILFWLVEHRTSIHEAIITMQREVAQRLIAQPGSKTYGALTIGVCAHATVEKLFDIRPGSFWPAPQVTSCTVHIRFPDPPPVTVTHPEQFRALVRTLFCKRRKMIRSSIPEAVLKSADIDPTARPEQLSIAELELLSRLCICT
jgi:16S rRNA (adenine1518-N6/adenine1519-N6)-dimethyltransferase